MEAALIIPRIGGVAEVFCTWFGRYLPDRLRCVSQVVSSMTFPSEAAQSGVILFSAMF